MKTSTQLVRENPEAYEQGKQACIACDCQPELATNPYEEKSDPWMAWNRGWNQAGI